MQNNYNSKQHMLRPNSAMQTMLGRSRPHASQNSSLACIALNLTSGLSSLEYSAPLGKKKKKFLNSLNSLARLETQQTVLCVVPMSH